MSEHENCNHEHGCCGNHQGGCHGHGEGGHCQGHGEGHHCQGHGGEGNCHSNGEGKGCGWGGKRDGAGRKCENKKIPFNRRLSEDAIQRIKDYAEEHNITETEALEIAVKHLIFEKRSHQ